MSEETLHLIIPPHGKKAVPVKSWAEIKAAAKHMMDSADAGGFPGRYPNVVALSHSQVSDNPKRFFVVPQMAEHLFDTRIMVNPVILEAKDPTKFKEACASFPFRNIKKTRRYSWIKVKYEVPTLLGTLKEVVREFTDFPAYVIQHELDHADGENIYDKFNKL